MKKKILCFLLTFVIVLGLCPISVFASKESGDKTVIIKVAPATASVTFYAGDNADGVPLAATDNGTNGKYHEYTLSIPEGTYSYRANDSGTDLGGMSFTVNEADEQSMTLVRTNFYTTDKSITSLGDYTIEIMPGSMRSVVNGTQYIDGSNRVVTPTLLWANGNGMLYNWAITLSEKLAGSKGVPISINNTFANDLTATQNKTFTLASLVDFTIKAPKGAKAQMFNQLKNFNVEEIPETANAVEGNLVSHTFRTIESANLTYRVSMDGKITRAGYIGATEKTEPIVISFEGNENPKSTTNTMDNANMQNRIESSTFVNVNRQNELDLSVGDSYRLRAYRGSWEIINSDTANIMIEPDFNYKVISGGEHISMTPANNRCTGNAKDNWMDIKGVSKGTAIIEISYDAIIIGGSGTSYTGLYGATAPNRTSLVVIRVGETAGTLDMKIKGRESAFDTELDTIYTVTDTASFAFSATLDSKDPTVSISTDKGSSWKSVTKDDGYFVASGLVPGINILKFEANGKVAYQVVRAAKISYTLTNESRTGDTICPGDKVTVTFNDTYMAIPKMSGIYNPSAHVLVYGTTSSASKQCGGYDLPSKCAITLTMPSTTGTATFEGGYLKSTMWCANDPMGAHRTLTDAGVGANFNAVQLTFTCGQYPTLTFDVTEKTECDHEWCDEEDCVITVKHTAVKAGEKRYTCTKCGEYKFESTKKGACTKFEVEVPALEATPTKDGHTAGTWCSECHKVLSGMETIHYTHEHEFTYSADKNALKATCSGTYCDYNQAPLTLTLESPSNSVYNGKPIEASLNSDEAQEWESATGKIPAITYKALDDGELTNGKPVEIGSYEASITAGDATATLIFDIAEPSNNDDGNNNNDSDKNKPDTIEPIDYRIIEGANSIWDESSEKSLSFRSNADFSKFVKVLLDGNLLDPSNYTASSGSTIITLKPEFASTLKSGKHTIEIVSTDGSALTNFYIEETIANTDGGMALESTLPSTFIAFSILGLSIVFFVGKKKKRIF